MHPPPMRTDEMKIDITELREGSNPVAFSVPAVTLETIVKEVDDLYELDGADCQVDFDVERYDTTLMVKGTISAPLLFSCARCLEQNHEKMAIKLRWTLLPRSAFATADITEEEGVELTSDDLDVSFYDGDEVDLFEIVREAILLELPPVPKCPVDSCSTIEYLRASAEEAEAPLPDPRWAALRAIQEQNAKKN